MKYHGVQAKDDEKGVGESWLTVEGILWSLYNASGTFREMEMCDETNKKVAKTRSNLVKIR